MTTQQLRATVETAALNAALKRLERCATDRRQTIPILAGVLIESDGAAGVIRLSVTDLDRQAVVTIPATIEGGGRAVPILAPLAAIVAKMDKGALIELHGAATVDATARKPEQKAPMAMICHRFRARLNGFDPDAFPVIAARPAAWSIQMAAGPLLAMLASAAKDATPPGAGDSKGIQFSFAADGLTVTAGTGAMMTRRRYPLPRMMAGGLAFKPKEGAAPMLATFEAGAIKALADSIDKPGKNDGDGPAVTIGFAVEAGMVTAAMIDTGGAVVTVKASLLTFPNVAAFDAAPRLLWFVADGDALAKAIGGLEHGAGDGLKRASFGVEWRRGPDGNDLAIGGAGDAGVVIEGYATATFDDCEAVELPALVAKAAKGGGRLKVAQLGGDLAGRGLMVIERGDGAAIYLCGRGPDPKETFARAYGAAFQARDRAGMVAAVAAYRAANGGRYVSAEAATARGMKPTRRQWARERRQESGRCDWQGFEWRVARLRKEAETAARGYAIERDRKGRAVLKACDDGRAERLAAGIVGRWNVPVVLTEAQAARFADLYSAGFDGKATDDYVPSRRTGRAWRGGYTAWAVMHPEGLPVPKVTRAKRAAPEAASEAPEAPAAVVMPEPAPEAASEPESAPVVAIEPEPPADDAGEGPEGDDVTAARHLTRAALIDVAAEAEALAAPIVADDTPPPVDPAPDLAATVAELLARVAALESARPVEAPVAPVEAPAPVAVEPVADATAEYWRARAIDAEARAKVAAADLAAMTAERDALAAESAQWAAWSEATRQRTAGRLRAIRATARELEAMHDSAVTRANDATRALAAEQGKVAALGRDLARMKAANPLAGLQWAPGHIGATVTATRGPANPAHPDYQAPAGNRKAA